MVICLDRGADLHITQLMPLPLTVSCFSKIQIGSVKFSKILSGTSSPGSRVVPDKGPLNVCVCVCACVHVCVCVYIFVTSRPSATAVYKMWLG